MTINERIAAAKAIASHAGIDATKNRLEDIANDYANNPILAGELARFADWILYMSTRHERAYQE